MIGIGININGMLSGTAEYGAMCSSSIVTPIDATETVGTLGVVCSSGAIVIDTVAAGAGIVVINGIWRLT